MSGWSFLFHRAAAAERWAHLPNRGFYLDVAYLERLIRHLRRTGWDIVTLDEALRRAGQPGARRFVNFSLDDGYRDTAETVVPLFRRLGVPITLFLTTGIPDGTLPLFFAGLEEVIAANEAIIDDDVRLETRSGAQKRAAFQTVAARWDAAGDHAARYRRFCRAHGAEADAIDDRHRITWEMIGAFRDDPCVEIGAHTVSHPHVAALCADDARHELAGSRARLEQVLDFPVRHFAFPYGQRADCGPRDFDMARAAGFRSAATTRIGRIGSGTDPFRLPRATLNGEHRALPWAYAHLSGATSLATRVLRRE